MTLSRKLPGRIILRELHSVKRGLNASAKSISPCQPLSAQSDMNRNFSLLLYEYFLHEKNGKKKKKKRKKGKKKKKKSLFNGLFDKAYLRAP